MFKYQYNKSLKSCHQNMISNSTIRVKQCTINGYVSVEKTSNHHFEWGNIIWNLYSLRWCHNEHDSISKHQPHYCLLKRLFGHRSKKTSKLHVTGLCVGNSPATGEFPAQMASNGENVSIWWCHHVLHPCDTCNASGTHVTNEMWAHDLISKNLHCPG